MYARTRADENSRINGARNKSIIEDCVSVAENRKGEEEGRRGSLSESERQSKDQTIPKAKADVARRFLSYYPLTERGELIGVSCWWKTGWEYKLCI